jgi:4-alpha-glucanotransferase
MRAYERFAQQDNHEGFNRFCEEEADWLDDYALFMVIRSLQGQQSWDRWPEPLRNRQEEALEQLRSRYQGELQRERFLQWLFFEQWYRLRRHCNGVGIRLVGDVPIYVSYDSADVWAHRTMFKLDENAQPTGVSGVPPDYFSATGQLWNNPVYDWEALKRSGYRWWIQRMKATFERFDIVRIDHFRGLVQFWEVAAGEATALNGQWMDVPTRDFFDTMLSHIPGFPVIAEDLGIITDDVREVMNHYGLPGMKVLLFAFGNDDGNHPYLPHSFERNCIVYTGTHDNNTILGWFEQEASEQDKQRLFAYLGRSLEGEELCRELVRVALASVADIAILAVQDVLCLGGWARMNNPSTVHNNWQWRLTKDEFAQLPAQWLAQLSRSYGRVPPELSKWRLE